MSFRVSSVYAGKGYANGWYKNVYTGTSSYIDAGESPEGTLTFNEPIAESELWCIAVRLSIYKAETENYEWRFYNLRNSQAKLWMNHASEAALSDGKADYSNAEFLGIALLPESYRLAEAKYFTDAGRITIPSGGYTLKDLYTNELLNTVDTNMSMTFGLKMDLDFLDELIEYSPINEDGKFLYFAGDVSSLKGKTVSWTLPAELNMSGSVVIPNFKSTSEQLSQGVPYVELVTDGDNITGINYAIVKSQDTTTTVTPSYPTDFMIAEHHTSGGKNASDWLNNYDGGKEYWEWDDPKPLNTLSYIRVRVRTWEDPDNPFVYQWDFCTAEELQRRASEAEQPNTPTSGDVSVGSSGCSGCSIGFTFTALFLAASLFILKKH